MIGIAIMLPFIACVETFEANPAITAAESMEGTMVIEANLSTLNKTQKVILSRILRVEDDSTVNVKEDRLFNANTPIIIKNGLGVNYEGGAKVEVMDSNDNLRLFQEVETGIYESLEPFAAQPGKSYQLTVATANGEEYISEKMETPPSSFIDDIYAEKILNENGEEGMGIFVDASFSSQESKILRYSYEETYKIVAPLWTPWEFDIIRDSLETITDNEGNVIEVLYPDVKLVPRAKEEQVCYRTDFSSSEVLFNGNTLNGTYINKNLIRFINKNNPIISHRYSILVKQWGISTRAYDFYKRLSAFSQNESVFSQVQPGSLEGNISSVEGDNRVIGFFDVSSEVSQRLFFNYRDFFSNESLPPYFGNPECNNIIKPLLGNPNRDGPTRPDCPQGLIPRVKLGLVEYIGTNADPGICEGPYRVVQTICGDCTLIGKNEVPEFWVE